MRRWGFVDYLMCTVMVLLVLFFFLAAYGDHRKRGICKERNGYFTAGTCFKPESIIDLELPQ